MDYSYMIHLCFLRNEMKLSTLINGKLIEKKMIGITWAGYFYQWFNHRRKFINCLNKIYLQLHIIKYSMSYPSTQDGNNKGRNEVK